MNLDSGGVQNRSCLRRLSQAAHRHGRDRPSGPSLEWLCHSTWSEAAPDLEPAVKADIAGRQKRPPVLRSGGSHVAADAGTSPRPPPSPQTCHRRSQFSPPLSIAHHRLKANIIQSDLSSKHLVVSLFIVLMPHYIFRKFCMGTTDEPKKSQYPMHVHRCFDVLSMFVLSK